MYKHLKNILFLTISMIVFAQELDAQRQRIPSKKITNIFSAGVLFGANLSQMDGDFFTGFDKMGLSGGIKAYTHLSYNFNLNIELLYTQKGSKIPHGTIVTAKSKNDRTIGLNYVEMPILAQLKLQPRKYNSYLEFGPSFSRLVSTNIGEKNRSEFRGTSYNEIQNELNSYELSAIMGLGFYYEKFDISLRYCYGLSKIYSVEKKETSSIYSIEAKEVYFLKNYHLGVMLSYKI